MSKIKQYQIVYFPFICMKDVSEIDLGFAKVWNFSKNKDKYIKDKKIIDKITKIFKCYKDHKRDIINEIAIVSIGKIDFRVLKEEELKLVKEVRYLLFLSFLSKNNTYKYNPNSGHQMATSDNFDVIYQNFILDNDNLSERVGEIITFNKGGYKLEDTTYQKPSFVPTPMRFEIDNDLSSHLIDLKDKKPRIYQRIINATEIFFESYYNSHYVSRNARILLQVSAFEIILKLSDFNPSPRQDFREKIKQISGHSGDKLYKYTIKFKSRGVLRSIPGRYTMKEIWADKVFQLRNKIIHGEKIKPTDFLFKRYQVHYDISLLFFVLVIKKQIEKSLRLNKYSCDYEINWESWKDEISQPEVVRMSGFVYKFTMRKFFERITSR